MNTPAADLRAGCRRAQQIGVLFLLMIALYAWVLGRVAAEHAPFIGFAPSTPTRLLRVVFALMGLAELVTVTIITRMLIRTFAATPLRGASTVGQRLLTLSIVRLATCESIAVLGVALFLLGGRWPDFYGFAVLSLAALLFHFPRLSQCEDWARQLPA